MLLRRVRPRSSAFGRRLLTLERLESRLAPAALTVNSTDDTGLPGTLRWAIVQANANAEADTINFAFSTPTTITLGSSLPTLHSDLAVQGPGAASLTVSGASKYRAFWNTRDATMVTSFRDFTIADAADTTAFNIGGPAVTQFGGSLTLGGMVFRGHRAVSDSAVGGAVGFHSYNTQLSQLSVSDCTFTNNAVSGGSAYGAALGIEGNYGPIALTGAAGVFQANSALTLAGFAVRGASAASGPVLLSNYGATFNRMLIADNTVTAAGSGAIWVAYSNPLIINDSTLTNNGGGSATGGAIHLDDAGQLVINRSVFAGNTASQGGAVYAVANTVMTVSESLFASNSASLAGGAVAADGSATITNSTFSGNTAGSAGATGVQGGALLLAKYGTITHATFTGNAAVGADAVGGGLAFGAGSTVGLTYAVRNTIAAGNMATTGPDVWRSGSSQTSLTFAGSVIGVGEGYTASGVTATLQGTAANPLDAKLAPLADNGGPTRTHALQPGSPALDIAATSYGLTTDQRGVGYARVVGGKADAGAYEVQPLAKITGVTVNGGAAHRSTLTKIDVTFSQSVSATGALADAFRLQPLGGGAALTPSIALVNGTTARLTFPGLPGGSLASGRYELTVYGSGLGNGSSQLDADGDGVAGGTYTLGAGSSLFRLYGDADGTGSVDAQDVTAFLNTYGASVGNAAYRVELDADGNGAVDAQDVTAFLNTYGVSLP